MSVNEGGASIMYTTSGVPYERFRKELKSHADAKTPEDFLKYIQAENPEEVSLALAVSQNQMKGKMWKILSLTAFGVGMSGLVLSAIGLLPKGMSKVTGLAVSVVVLCIFYKSDKKAYEYYQLEMMHRHQITTREQDWMSVWAYLRLNAPEETKT